MENIEEKRTETPNDIAGFVAKTYEILNNSEFHKIIFWSTNGTEFIIKDINKFQEIVLPKYFRHRNVNSFIRQLNMYGFHKARKQNTRSVFSHPYFMRNKEHLLCMVRRKIKNLDQGQDSSIQAPMAQQESVKSIKSIRSIKDLSLSVPQTRASSTKLEAVSPMKSLISTNELIKTNINISIRRLSFRNMDSRVNFDEDIEKEEDNVSIEDELQKHRSDFSRRVGGLSLINTSIFLQEMKEHY